MAEAKTKATKASVAAFLAKVPNAGRRADAEALVAIFERATGEQATMWGPSIVGFGAYHYRYESGREGDMCLVGFSPRSTSLVLYVKSGAPGEDARLAKLGELESSTGCLYVKRLADLDAKVLEALVRASAAHTRKRHVDPAPAKARQRGASAKSDERAK